MGVIRAALALLERDQGPILEDYPHDVPPLPAEGGAACPVSFAKDKVDDGTWRARLTSELKALQPWYELSLRRRKGRTLVGISDRTPVENAALLGETLDAGEVPQDIPWMKRAIEDLKIYYVEAMTAQPGDYDAAAIQALFWKDTVLGDAILSIYRVYQDSDNNQLKLVARMLAPREAVGAATGPGGESPDA